MTVTQSFTEDASGVTRENGIYYIEVTGTPYEMGKKQGTLLRDQIKDAVADYKANVVKLYGQKDADLIFDWVLNKADFTSSIEEHLPHVLEELRGIAEGADLSFEDVLLSNMFEEVYVAAPLKLGLQAAGSTDLGCTAFTTRCGDKGYAGQNMDYSSNLRERQLVVRYIFPDKRMLIYCFVGQIGGIGVNSNSLSALINTLPQGALNESDGLGSAFILRLMLEQDSAAEALEKLKAIPRFSGNNFTLTDRHQGMIVECDADQVIPRMQSDEKNVVVATNHTLHLDYRLDMPGLFENGEPIRSSPILTIERLEFAERFLNAKGEDLSVHDLMSMLTVTPVNFYNHDFETLQTVIVELDGDDIRFFVSAGFDPYRKWNEYSFDE
jgi:predicted choloylglycine hydrolase